MTLVCRHPYTWGSRAWPWPLQGHLRGRWATLADSHNTPEDSDQSLQPDISQSSAQCPGWSGCIWRGWGRTTSRPPARSGRTGWGCPPTRRRAPGRGSCPGPVCSGGPVRWGQSGWTCPGCNPRQLHRKIHFPATRKTKRSMKPEINCY